MEDNENEIENDQQEKVPQESQTAWSFRGYKLHTKEFSTALADLYQGEIQRANIWRTRLDTTTNWAVLTTAAVILVSFIGSQIHYTVIVLCTLLVTFCLIIEARRYRYYELWSYRVRLMETDFFAAMLVPPFAPSPEWAESLAESLLQPSFSISSWEATGRRFRRNYFWLYLLLGATLLLKLFLQPVPANSWDILLSRVSLGPVPGWIIILVGFLFNLVLFVIGFATAGLRQASGEVLPKFGDFSTFGNIIQSDKSSDGEIEGKSVHSPFRQRHQLLSFIITAKPENIATRVMGEMKRGVTGLHGQGMYTHSDREVLMVAVMVTEMARLKSLVREEDPNAFVIVTHAQGVFGRGFNPLSQV